MIVDIPEAVLRRALESFRRDGGYGYPTSQWQRARMRDARTIAAAIKSGRAAPQSQEKPE